MKINLLFITLFLSIVIQSQEKKDTLLLNLAKANHIYYISNSFQDLKDGILYRYEEDIKKLDEGSFYNNTVLNEYFKNIISAYATNTGDLSFENYFANVNATANTLTFGRSFRFDNFYFNKDKRAKNKVLKPVRKLGNLLTVYGKANYSNGFANLYSEQKLEDGTEAFKLNSGLGIGFKFTHIFNGKITVTNENVEKIEKIREIFVQNAIDTKIADYEKNEFQKDVMLANYGINDVAKKEANKENLVKNKYFQFYKEIMLEELEKAKSMNIIKSSHVSWISLSTYIPITDISINYSTNNIEIQKATYKDNNLTKSTEFDP